jgi:transcriptional regulator
MYIPQFNHISDPTLLHDLMERFSFATLVTVHDGAPFATHLPFLVYPDVGEQGTLVAHMARANVQWKDFARDDEVLVIFQGSHAYISPSWYDAHPSVPTWNYAVVHAYGVPRIVTDETQVLATLHALVAKHEAPFAEPWSMDDLTHEYLHKMMRGIVAFEIPVARLEGKFKLSQNRSAEDRQHVIEALGGSPDSDSQGVRAMMQALAGQGT